MTKPVYGGNAQAVFTSGILPQMATMRAKAISPIAPDSARKGDIITIAAVSMRQLFVPTYFRKSLRRWKASSLRMQR